MFPGKYLQGSRVLDALTHMYGKMYFSKLQPVYFYFCNKKYDNVRTSQVLQALDEIRAKTNLANSVTVYDWLQRSFQF